METVKTIWAVSPFPAGFLTARLTAGLRTAQQFRAPRKPHVQTLRADTDREMDRPHRTDTPPMIIFAGNSLDNCFLLCFIFFV